MSRIWWQCPLGLQYSIGMAITNRVCRALYRLYRETHGTNTKERLEIAMWCSLELGRNTCASGVSSPVGCTKHSRGEPLEARGLQTAIVSAQLRRRPKEECLVDELNDMDALISITSS